MPAQHSYADLLAANAWIRKASDAFYFQCTARTVQESKLFPVNPYIALSYLNAWYRYPELFRKIEAVMPAEEIGDHARERTTSANIITNGIIEQFYLGGRQMLMDMGMLKATDAIDDVMYVLDFTQRLNLSYHRNHAHILPTDAGLSAQLLPERQVQVFEADALGTKPGDKLHTSVAHFLAAVSQYAFLKNSECRLGIHNSGPYKVGGGEMLVREFVDLAESDLPWLDGVAENVELNNVTMPVFMKDTHFNIVDDWASFEAQPSYNHDNMYAVGLYTSDYLSDGYIPVHMDSASELADYLDHLRDAIHDATQRLWKEVAGWSRDQMIDSGLLVYYNVPKDLAHIAGVYEQEDWYTVEDRVQRFKPLFNDEYGNHLIAELVGYISLRSQQGNESHMAKLSGARGDMWSTIPYSVLGDEEWTGSVGPIRGGSTSLPQKTALYTTTRGKLTQDQCNEAARALRVPTLEDGLRHLDDAWVKTHPDDPRAHELYRRTQARSLVLQDKGAGLSREDVLALRKEAGRDD
jgi:hypothetical protein